MLFNSFPFLYPLSAGVVVGYYAVPTPPAAAALVVLASYYFYAYADWWFPALMAGSTAISYTADDCSNTRVARGRSSSSRPGSPACSRCSPTYKYTAFVGGYALSFVARDHAAELPGLHSFVNSIALPIGISFYTFEGISYIVDVYRGDLEVERDPLRYAFFISFFPHLDRRADRALRNPPAAARAEAPLRPGPRALGLDALHARPCEEGAARGRARHWVDHYLATPARSGS